MLGFDAEYVSWSDPEQLDALLYMVSVGLLKTEISYIAMNEVDKAHQQMKRDT